MNSASLLSASEERIPRSGTKDAVGLMVSLAIALGVTGLSSLALFNTSESWYASAHATLWTPPPSALGPVWLVIYGLMAVSAWLIWRLPVSSERYRVLAFYTGQLALNAGWTPLFFLGYDLMGPLALWGALGWIVMVNFVVLATMAFMWPLRKSAAVLMMPYWAWLLFATALNASLAVMNS